MYGLLAHCTVAISLFSGPEGLDTATVTPANASQTATVFIVVGVVIGIVAILVVIVALCIIRRQHKLPPPVEDIQEMEEAEIQREAELHEANLSLRTEIAQGDHNAYVVS